ncbi:5'-nucleotidase C-terminal domain-containing protein [Allomuricauda sp. F6463D]|uniref:5'-nucleotidase C-terminal domain-containing protein n=1 Tax=Allomuricauda sp. F6463D TaxID=2926409 RepID=UPI001FF3DF49|nr:5'-nucleotidase [Muricauda sp. F6463D]MCK0159820.1 5'-nucleotidase C-terminal domain-containing protein [Muricauda sp. F6463D]
MRNLIIKQFVTCVTFCVFISCKSDTVQLTEVKGKQIPIDSTISHMDSISSFVTPYRIRINEILDSTLAYAPKPLLLNDGKRNTSMGNLMADIVFKETVPIFKTRTGNDLDFVVLNYGGVRSIISEGNVSARNAYEVMPFENYIEVVELSGSATRQLINFVAKASRRHPVSGIQIITDKNRSLESVNIQGQPFDESRNYYVATSDYLVSGGPSVGFFNEIISITETDYLLRNAIIDHFKKVDTLKAVVDDRIIQLD